MTGMVGDLDGQSPTAMRAAASMPASSTATDVADWLVRELALPFRDAHHVVGSIVRLAEEHGARLADLPLEVLRGVEPRIDERVYAVLAVESAVESRTSFGGTAPERVRQAVAAARERYL